jgi:hypothetical protein
MSVPYSTHDVCLSVLTVVITQYFVFDLYISSHNSMIANRQHNL